MADVQPAPPTLHYRSAASPQRLTVQPLPDGVRILFPIPADPIPRHILAGMANLFAGFFVHFGIYIGAAIVLFGISMTLSLVRFWAAMIVRDSPWQIHAIVLIGAAVASIHFWA